MIRIAEDLGQQLGVKRACEELGVPRSSLYDARQPVQPPAPRSKPARSLKHEERQAVRDVLNSDRHGARCTAFWMSSRRSASGVTS
jgi:hypothetical protein